MTVRTELVPGDVVIDDDPIIATFVAELGTLWLEVAPWCLDPGADVCDVPTRADGDPRDLAELDALLAGWPHFGPSERAVLAAAHGYLAGTAGAREGVPALVVDATVRALLRGPRH